MTNEPKTIEQQITPELIEQAKIVGPDGAEARAILFRMPEFEEALKEAVANIPPELLADISPELLAIILAELEEPEVQK